MNWALGLAIHPWCGTGSRDPRKQTCPNPCLIAERGLGPAKGWDLGQGCGELPVRGSEEEHIWPVELCCPLTHGALRGPLLTLPGRTLGPANLALSGPPLAGHCG